MNLCAAYHRYVYIFVIIREKWDTCEYMLNILYICISAVNLYIINERGLVKNILCFHDELSSISVQGESNNGGDFVTALWAFISFIRVILCFV